MASGGAWIAPNVLEVTAPALQVSCSALIASAIIVHKLQWMKSKEHDLLNPKTHALWLGREEHAPNLVYGPDTALRYYCWKGSRSYGSYYSRVTQRSSKILLPHFADNEIVLSLGAGVALFNIFD